jgi:hypothetical protein
MRLSVGKSTNYIYVHSQWATLLLGVFVNLLLFEKRVAVNLCHTHLLSIAIIPALVHITSDRGGSEWNCHVVWGG